MPVAVGVAAAINDLRIVQQRVAVHVLCGLHLLQEVGELADVAMINLGHLLNPIRPVAVVREIVMAVVDADFGEVAVVAVAGDHERSDARGVGLERKEHHVEHEPDVFR